MSLKESLLNSLQTLNFISLEDPNVKIKFNRNSPSTGIIDGFSTTSGKYFLCKKGEKIIQRPSYKNTTILKEQVFKLKTSGDSAQFVKGNKCLSVKGNGGFEMKSCKNKSTKFVENANDFYDYEKYLNTQNDLDAIYDTIQLNLDKNKDSLVLPPPGEISENPIVRVREKNRH